MGTGVLAETRATEDVLGSDRGCGMFVVSECVGSMALRIYGVGAKKELARRENLRSARLLKSVSCNCQSSVAFCPPLRSPT